MTFLMLRCQHFFPSSIYNDIIFRCLSLHAGISTTVSDGERNDFCNVITLVASLWIIAIEIAIELTWSLTYRFSVCEVRSWFEGRPFWEWRWSCEKFCRLGACGARGSSVELQGQLVNQALSSLWSPAFEGGSSYRSVAPLMYVYESFKVVRAANEAPSITIWDVISVVGGMEQGQARVAQSGLGSPLCPTGEQQQEDEVSEWKESPRRGEEASTGLTHRSARHIATILEHIRAGSTRLFVGKG